jgi:hypothetical protein
LNCFSFLGTAGYYFTSKLGVAIARVAAAAAADEDIVIILTFLLVFLFFLYLNFVLEFSLFHSDQKAGRSHSKHVELFI